jgi:sortase (surface protein transpeptidase)
VLNFSVTRNDIVSPSIDLSTYDNKDDIPQVILVTCHPEYSTEERLVIVAELRASSAESA